MGCRLVKTPCACIIIKTACLVYVKIHFTVSVSRFTKSGSHFTKPIFRFTKSASRFRALNRSPDLLNWPHALLSGGRFTISLSAQINCPCAACYTAALTLKLPGIIRFKVWYLLFQHKPHIYRLLCHYIIIMLCTYLESYTQHSCCY